MPELDYTDSQEQSEIFDEDNQNLDGEGGLPGEMKTFEELPEVPDFTTAPGDDRDDPEIVGDEPIDDDEVIRLGPGEAPPD